MINIKALGGKAIAALKMLKDIKISRETVRAKAKEYYAKLKEILIKGKDIIVLFMESHPYTWENKTNNRRFIITLTSLLILNYVMFCYHSGKNIFSIFPNIPPISSQHEVTVFLPALDGKTLIEEKRKAAKFESEERFIHFLFNNVVQGSMFENTAFAVPVDMNIRTIWMLGKSENNSKDICAIDCGITAVNPQIKPLPDSELLFREALRKTITANIPHIEKVVLLEGGMPDKKFW